MVVQHNIAAMNTNRMYGIVTGSKMKKSEKLSSGYRINRAADDAAGLSISEEMRWMIRGLRQGTRNTQDGISFIQIADGAMNEVHDMLHRMEELSVQAANGTLKDDERCMIDNEVQNLKVQINQISYTTVFNDIPIFDNSSAIFVHGSPNDMSFYNASYDDTTGDYTYGGFIFNGERVAWDKVDADMIDKDTGLFTGGTYQYSNGSTCFTISANEQGEIPEITRTMSVSASSSGVLVDGNLYDWSKVRDEAGNPLTADFVHGGTWTMDFKGAEIAFTIAEDVNSLSDFATAISNIMDKDAKVHYVWESVYAGDRAEQAVDVTKMSNIRVSNAIANAIASDPSYALIVDADENGIRLKDKSGTLLSNSEKTWADMGISSWDSGSYISSSKTYQYAYGDAIGELVSFDFKLSDETSVDSVIDGLNGMRIDATKLTTNYMTEVKSTASFDRLSVSGNINVDFTEEYALGRNFDQSKPVLATENLQYDASQKEAKIEFAHGGATVISLSGSTKAADDEITAKLSKYMDTLSKIMEKSFILGAEYKALSLKELVGEDHITTSGYFDDNVTLDAGMEMTSGEPGVIGKTYPTASINFENLNSAEKIMMLAETGFDSTCKTCSNHYSVSFVDGLTGYSETEQGYRYKLNKNGTNALLQIDVNSLVDHGVDNGTKLAKALVDITDKNFDYHYTQYAAKDATLYIYDNRSQAGPAPNADFWTAVYEDEKIANINMQLKDDAGDGSRISLSASYDISKIAADSITVSANADADGLYVKNADLMNDPSKAGYSLYDASTMGSMGLQRYQIEVGYKDAGGTATTKSNAVTSQINKVLNDLLSNTTVKLSANNYTNMYAKAQERANVNMEPTFDPNVYCVGDQKGIYIVHSGMKGDRTFIPIFAMNTAALGIASANTRTTQAACKTIELTKIANEELSTKRSRYGALQNRLEHTMKSNQNAEENLEAAESRIRDADMAKESMELARDNILSQVVESMLAQANQSNQGVLALL